MKWNREEILQSLKGGLIVSCQVQHDDPCYSEDFVLKMAQSAKWAGAVGIRANSPEQIKLIKEAVDLPMIGLYKIWHDDTDVLLRLLWTQQNRSGKQERKLLLLIVRIRLLMREDLHGNCFLR